jgi:hypothetical protein
MGTYARVNAYGEVENVIVADAAFIKSRPDAGSYVETFEDANGDAAKFYNYAGIGYRFDAQNKVFISPTPYPSWVLSDKFRWQAPVPIPQDGKLYTWDEPTVSWVAVADLPAA